MVNILAYSATWLMRIAWFMSALLYEISGRYLLEDIREETGADDGAFPDGMN